jgi:hypothetical protein
LWTHSKKKLVLCSSRVCWLHTQISDRYQIDLAYLQYGKECTADPLFTNVVKEEFCEAHIPNTA